MGLGGGRYTFIDRCFKMATFTRRKKRAEYICIYITEREPHRAELPRWKVSQQEGYFVG